jgi:hypothetical protein
VVLCVVQEKRLDGPLSLLLVEPGSPSIDGLAAWAWGVAGSRRAGSGLAGSIRASRPSLLIVDGGCLFVGVIGLGYE